MWETTFTQRHKQEARAALAERVGAAVLFEWERETTEHEDAEPPTLAVFCTDP